AAGAAPCVPALHTGWARRVHRPRPRLVRSRLGRLGPHLRRAASARSLRAEPGGRARDRPRLLPQPPVLPPLLLPTAPSRHRLAVDAVRRRRALGGLASRRPARSARAFPALLGRGARSGLHASGVEAALLSPAVHSPARVAHGAPAGAPRPGLTRSA